MTNKNDTYDKLTVPQRAVACMNQAVDADTENRAAAIDDLNFSYGEQWPSEIKMQRQLDKRPCLTINKTDTFVRSVVNSMRQQRPRIKVHPVSDGADQQTAEVLEGLMRHIEVQSNAELAYDTGCEYQVRMGWGYWRVAARYVDERSFDQELYIERIRNPFSVYFDPSSTSPDGLDSKWVVITDRIRKEDFRQQYPGKSEQDFKPSGQGDGAETWSSKEEIMIAEYWRVEERPEKLFQLSDGSSVFQSEADGAKGIGDMVGNHIIMDLRDSMKRVVMCSKVTKTQVLEEMEWPGRYIPIVPVYGSEQVLDGRSVKFGMVRQLKDPQRMYNFWRPLSLDTPILTPTGWSTMGALHAGDQVFDENGLPCNVIGESPVHLQRACYKVVFDDGSHVIADGEHPWTVEERGQRKSRTFDWIKKDVTTAELVPNKHFIYVTKPLQLPDADLAIDPYLLGAWLGDGYSAEPRLCQADVDIDELRSILLKRGMSLGEVYRQEGKIGSFQVLGIRKEFTKLNLLNNKHIPDAYLYASEAQRWSLLQGLMDTDGSISKGLCSFTTTSEKIAAGFSQLVRSLGIKAKFVKRTGRISVWDNGGVSEHADAWQYSFSAYSDQPVFALSRKASKLPDVAMRQDRRTKRHSIVSVTPVDSVPVKCIAVDTPTHLFLCGLGLIPTHNTQETEFVALAPKAPWLIAEGQIENHEAEWATANVKNHSTLTYKPISDENGQPIPPPQRLNPQAVPAASINAAMAASEDLKAVAGMFDPALGAPGNETSGTMVAQRQGQSDLSNYHFYDNLTRSIRATGIILLDLFKTYYSGERVVRIIGESGEPDTVTINKQQADKILHDVNVGRYDVIMATGPGYDSKRQESAAMMVDLLRHMPQLGQIAGDLIVGSMDWPGASAIADRLKAANPIAQMSDSLPKDMPPDAQKYVMNIMGQLHQAQQQLQQLQQEKQAKVFGVQEREQSISDREMQKEVAETHRAQMREQAALERTKLEAHARLLDTKLRTSTDMHETLIDAHTDLELARHAALNRGGHSINRFE